MYHHPFGVRRLAAAFAISTPPTKCPPDRRVPQVPVLYLSLGFAGCPQVRFSTWVLGSSSLKTYNLKLSSPGAPGSVFYLGLGFAFSCFVIPTAAARSSLPRRLPARRAAQRDLCAPCASPGPRDRGTTIASWFSSRFSLFEFPFSSFVFRAPLTDI